MTPEGRIKNEILSYLCSIDNSFFWPVDVVGIWDPNKRIFRRKNSIYHIRGISDILGVYNGRSIAIEVKTKTGRLSDYQKLFLASFNKAGGLSLVARSVLDVKIFFNDLRNAQELPPK